MPLKGLPISSEEVKRLMITLVSEGTGEIFYATKYSAGFDIPSNSDLIIPPGEWRAIPTGLRITEAQPAHCLTDHGTKLTLLPELQIRPRSGLAARHGVTILNAPSTIDADYRGEILVLLINHSKRDFVIRAGDRIAQGVVTVVMQPDNITIRETARGAGGFGSTGLN